METELSASSVKETGDETSFVKKINDALFVLDNIENVKISLFGQQSRSMISDDVISVQSLHLLPDFVRW